MVSSINLFGRTEADSVCSPYELPETELIWGHRQPVESRKLDVYPLILTTCFASLEYKLGYIVPNA